MYFSALHDYNKDFCIMKESRIYLNIFCHSLTVIAADMISCQSKNGQAWEGSSLDIFEVSTQYQFKKSGILRYMHTTLGFCCYVFISGIAIRSPQSGVESFL